MITCPKCGNFNPCSKFDCPLTARFRFKQSFNIKAKQDFFGEAPNVFVGRFGYPNINVGILGVEDYIEQDNPLLWSRENFQINQVIDFRNELINSNFKANIKSFDDKFLKMSQEISMANKPVDVEIHLNKRPFSQLSFSDFSMPMGPRIRLEDARITENPKIPAKVEKLVDDYDLKAANALDKLYKKGFDEHYLTKLISVGNLGVKAQRKLVPTRWSITTVDDTLGKYLIEEIKQYQQSNYLAYFGNYLGNYYLVLFFPDVFRYELFETYVADCKGYGIFKSDYEDYFGRKNYADNTVGGYYAARLAILEEMKRIKRQASTLTLRFITNEYWAHLGVWVVREATRKSMNSKPIEFASKELMLAYAKNLVKKKFGYDLDKILKESMLLNTVNKQSKLTEF